MPPEWATGRSVLKKPSKGGKFETFPSLGETDKTRIHTIHKEKEAKRKSYGDDGCVFNNIDEYAL